MPTRILRDCTDSEAIESLDWQAQALFMRLIMKADDYGRFTAHPKLLISLCFPLRNDVREADISRCLAACQKAGVICLYEAGGKRFLEIVKFGQRERTPSKYPAPPYKLENCPPNDRKPPSNDGLGECGGGGGGGGGSGACAPSPATADNAIPTADEVVAFGAGCTPVIPADYCRDRHARHTEDHKWITAQGRLIDWRAKFRRYWSQDCRTWGAKVSLREAMKGPKKMREVEV